MNKWWLWRFAAGRSQKSRRQTEVIASNLDYCNYAIIKRSSIRRRQFQFPSVIFISTISVVVLQTCTWCFAFSRHFILFFCTRTRRLWLSCVPMCGIYVSCVIVLAHFMFVYYDCVKRRHYVNVCVSGCSRNCIMISWHTLYRSCIVLNLQYCCKSVQLVGSLYFKKLYNSYVSVMKILPNDMTEMCTD